MRNRLNYLFKYEQQRRKFSYLRSPETEFNGLFCNRSESLGNIFNNL